MAFNNQRATQRANTDGQSRSEFIEQIVKISRVSKKTKGGNKVGFSALAVVGDGKGKVGVGLGKAPDVSSAVRKGISMAKKHMVSVPLIEGTIPSRVDVKVGAARVMLKPAPRGSGIIAGGAVRSVVAAAGITNISSKVLGSNNQAGNVNATLEALRQLSLLHEKKEAQALAAKSE